MYVGLCYVALCSYDPAVRHRSVLAGKQVNAGSGSSHMCTLHYAGLSNTCSVAEGGRIMAGSMCLVCTFCVNCGEFTEHMAVDGKMCVQRCMAFAL